MKRFEIPVNVTLKGRMIVEAETPGEAMLAAQTLNYKELDLDATRKDVQAIEITECKATEIVAKVDAVAADEVLYGGPLKSPQRKKLGYWRKYYKLQAQRISGLDDDTPWLVNEAGGD